MGFEAVAAESAALRAAIAAEPDAREVPRVVLRTMLEHHRARGFGDLRVMYLAGQLLPETRTVMRP